MTIDSENRRTTRSRRKDDLPYVPSTFMQGFSLKAIFAADLLLFAAIALIFLGVTGYNPSDPASAEEGRAAASAPPPVDSLQGSSRKMHFSTITSGSEDHWNERDFRDSWSDDE